jgi:hypothetical protein
MGLRKVESAVFNGEIRSGRDNIEVVSLDWHSVRCLEHGHRRVTREQIHHHTFVGGVEMLNQNEGHAAVGGQRVQKAPAGI